MAYWEVDTNAELTAALAGASNGDEIYILERYDSNPYSGTYTVNTAGLYIHAHEDARFSGGFDVNASNTTIEGLIWENFTDSFEIGASRSSSNPLTDIIFTDCKWLHGGNYPMRLWYVEDFLIEGCEWGDVRSRTSGIDTVGVNIKRYAKHGIFRECTAWDIGSDWLQVMPNAPVCEECEDILIDNCHAWVNRPYGSESWHDFSTNVSENGLDIKGYLTNYLTVRNCSFGGFEPTVAGQDCSGDSAGPAVRVHYGASYVYFETCTFFSSERGLVVSYGEAPEGYETGPVYALGCTCTDIDVACYQDNIGDALIIDASWPNEEGIIVDVNLETGDFSEFTSVQNAESPPDLAITEAAALADTNYGMAFTIDDTTYNYGQVDFTTLTSDGWRCRIYIDASSMSMGTGDSFQFVILRSSGNNDRFMITLGYGGSGDPLVSCTVLNDSYSNVSTSGYPISDIEHYVEVDVQRASSGSASDGSMRLWIDDLLQETISNIDIYDISQPGYVRLGPRGLEGTTSGTLCLDEFILNDDHSHIGSVPQQISGVAPKSSYYRRRRAN